MRGHRVAAAAALALLAFPGWFAVEAQAARFSFSAPRVFVPRFRAPVFRAPRVYRMPSVPRRLPVAPQVRRIAPPTSPPTVFKPPPAPRVVQPSIVHNPSPKPSPVAPPIPRLAKPAPPNPPAAAPAQGQWRPIAPVAVAKPVPISPALAHPPSPPQAKPLAPGQWNTLQPVSIAKPSAPSHPALPATPAAINPSPKPLQPGKWTSISTASAKTGPSPATGAPSPSSSIKPPAVGKPGGPSTTSLASAPPTAPASTPAKSSTAPSSGQWTSTPAVSNPAASTPPVVAPAPVAAPKTNAPSGYVQIQTANGPAYFQQTPSGLAIVSDPTTLSKLKNGTLPSTVQPYSPSLTFATSPASSAPSNPSTVPSSTPSTSIPAASNPASSTPPGAAPKTNAPSGYVQIQTASGPAYFQQTPSGLAIVSDPTTLSKLKNGTLPSSSQPYSPSLVFSATSATANVGAGSVPSVPAAPPSQTASATPIQPGQWGPVPASSQTPLPGNQNLLAAASQPSTTFSSINTTTAMTTPNVCTSCSGVNLFSTPATALQTRPGQILVNTLAAAGGEVSKSHVLAGLGYAADGASILNAYQTQGSLMAWSTVSGVVAVRAAGAAGQLVGGPVGGALAAGGTQMVVDFGQLYVAPRIGSALFDAFPSLFTPPSTVTVPGSAFRVGATTPSYAGSVITTTNAISTPMRR